MLYPLNTETRIVIDLSGIWKFKIPDEGEKVALDVPLTNPIQMAVPGSFNDQVANAELREHVGEIWYEKDFTISKMLNDQRLVIRFGSVTHQGKVYFNGEYVGEHVGGFTPFEIEIASEKLNIQNNLKLCLSNILDNKTLPNAVLQKKNNKKKVIPNFDFYNYSGIHRPIKIYSTPKTYINDITVTYDVDGNNASVKPKIDVKGDYDRVSYELYDDQKQLLLNTDQNEFLIENVKRWQPRNAYLYQLKVNLHGVTGEIIDTYTEEFGVRTLKIENNKFYINDKPFYFKGFGKHEDFPVIGRGLNEAVNNGDFNLMKWTNANSLRTAHYPYSEEFMYMADREGFVVIDEVPGVGLFNKFNVDVSKNKDNNVNTWDIVDSSSNHKQVIEELISRDKNHPCVVSWAVGNEPAGHQEGARKYFEPLVSLAKELDWEKRAVVIPNIINADPDKDELTGLVDIICLNRYYGWYINHGELEEAKVNLKREMEKWHEKYPDKPIMFSEFGADTISGFNSVYGTPFTEEYQVDYFNANFEVLDKLSYFIGEHVWNFADFETHPTVRRVDGNKKGIFTRDRKPKSIAHYLKKRWENK
ncbi:beta-glucuronidase [Enterococcus sp. DIV0240d]|uniref:beta-glucuronidase n=1 Tax=Enterococcus sp. DIV0240d TaxID=2774717 RepID=UPI003F25FE4A